MAAVLVIGYGNPLRGDDGFGWHAAQSLDQDEPGGALEVIACHQLTPELAEPVSRARLVIFIDAERGEVPGQCSCQAVEPQRSTAASLSHQCDPSTLLTWAQTLYGTCPPAVLLCVTGQSFAHEEELSPALRAALPAVQAKVHELATPIMQAGQTAEGKFYA
jgi:hydrogenase maturation protease